MEGLWGKDQVQVTIVNVYAPCDLRGKKFMWEEIINSMESRGGDRWCVLGDFNSIKSSSERRGVDGFNRNEEVQLFRDFLAESGLIDLPLVGRKFTWYKPDGSAMSRLDKFLISEEWLSTWSNLSQWGLKRSVLDHCAAVLKEKEINWGLKPFRVMKCWEDMEGYENFVKEAWKEIEVDGWKCYILKEKLKIIKNKLKGWNKDHF